MEACMTSCVFIKIDSVSETEFVIITMNKFYYTRNRLGDVIEHAVTLETGSDHLIQNVIKTRYFDSEQTAWSFFTKVVHNFKHRPPFEALCKFNTFGIKRKNILSHVLRQHQRIKHRINLPDGSYSVWVGRLQGNLILRTDEKGNTSYKTLTAFASAHYQEVLPERKSNNGWKECEAKVRGEWVKMVVLRELRE